jgi:hypothetical protein
MLMVILLAGASMSSWVVPSIAAEIWNVSVDVILDWAKSGMLSSREVESFLFVDLAPAGEWVMPGNLPGHPTPPTYSVLTSEEMAALHAGTEEEELGEPFEPEEIQRMNQPDISQWRTVRQKVATTRRPPSRAIAA